MKNINDKSRSVQDEVLKLTKTTRNEISTTTTEALDSLDITLATVLDQAAVAVQSVVKGSDFDIMMQDRINNYIQSYPQEINDEMIKFAKIFFTDNETIEHYIREVARSATKIGGIIQEQLEKEINRLATEWVERNLETGKKFKEMTDPTIKEENYNSEESGKDNKEKEDEYTGGRPTLFQEASWQRGQEEEARVTREAQDAAYK
jgi:hypothetical protein